MPQGSILGPLFFLIYVNDIKYDDIHVKTLLYADDTVLYVSGKDIKQIAGHLQRGLNGYCKWSSSDDF